MFLWLLTFYQTGPNGLFIFYQVFNLILQSASLYFLIFLIKKACPSGHANQILSLIISFTFQTNPNRRRQREHRCLPHLDQN